MQLAAEVLRVQPEHGPANCLLGMLHCEGLGVEADADRARRSCGEGNAVGLKYVESGVRAVGKVHSKC